MKKIKLGARPFFYPLPIVVVGSKNMGRVNFTTASFCSIIQKKPPLVQISLETENYSNSGIKENQSFSLNIPNVSLIKEVDYCGLVSGRDVDKSKVFKTFTGSLNDVPMITDCPVNLECKLVDLLNYNSGNDIFIGEIVEAYSSDEYIIDGVPNLAKINTFLFSIYENSYYSTGKKIGEAWREGKDYIKGQ